MASKVGSLRSVASKSTPETLGPATSIKIKAWGDPSSNLCKVEEELPPLQPGEVLIKILAAPINPSDILTVMGVYPLKPELPGVGGHEGVGQVMALGSQSTKFKVGDFVVPLEPALGTWRTHGNFREEAWHAVPAELSLEDAATLPINPGTALLMLETFTKLKAGDVVIQNGANSAVGQYVIQIAKSMGVKTINVVRDKPGRNWEDTVKWLKEMGADAVVTPDDVESAAELHGLPEPVLALNCVGGELATTMANTLARSGTLVTYGAMASMEFSMPIPLLLFKDIRARGFWISGKAIEDLGAEGHAALFDRLAQMIVDGVITSPCSEADFHSIEAWESAIEAAKAGSSKVLLRMSD